MQTRATYLYRFVCCSHQAGLEIIRLMNKKSKHLLQHSMNLFSIYDKARAFKFS
jgi:hypothetical protein